MEAGTLVFLPALFVSAAGLISTFIAYYPGGMTWDSFVLWGMGWEWPWHDWHSPYIALLMGLSRRLMGDPSVLLFFQLLLSWSGLYLCACGLRRHSATAAVLLPLLGFTPMLVVLSGYLHKTPLQAAVFLFVFGAAYFHHQWKRTLGPPWLVVLVLLLLLGLPLRELGLACALPLGVFLLEQRHGRTGARAVVGGLLATVILIGASLALHHLVVYRVLGALKLHKVQTLYRYDLAAIYAHTGVDFAPRMLKEPYRSHARMQELYERERGMWRVMYAYEGGIPEGYAVPKDVTERLLSEEEVAYYRDAWLKAVREHPGTWVQQKLHTFSIALGLKGEMFGFRRARLYRSRQNVYSLTKRGGVFYRVLNRSMRRLGGSVLLRPWLWLVLGTGLLVAAGLAARRGPEARRAMRPVFVLLVSAGLLYPQLCLVALDNDLRFSYWAIVATVLALALFAGTLPALARHGDGEQSRV